MNQLDIILKHSKEQYALCGGSSSNGCAQRQGANVSKSSAPRCWTSCCGCWNQGATTWYVWRLCNFRRSLPCLFWDHWPKKRRCDFLQIFKQQTCWLPSWSHPRKGTTRNPRDLEMPRVLATAGGKGVEREPWALTPGNPERNQFGDWLLHNSLLDVWCYLQVFLSFWCSTAGNTHPYCKPLCRIGRISWNMSATTRESCLFKGRNCPSFDQVQFADGSILM